MKGEYKTDFQRAFYCLPANKLQDVADEIMEKLEWSASTFQSKRNGSRKLKNPEKCMLKNIFKQYGIEI